MKLLYGTTNQGKLEWIRRRLAPIFGLEVIGLMDMQPPLPSVQENGLTPLENARIKAWAYYEAFHCPVFSCDSGLYFEGLPQEIQPGIHVRRVGGKELTDDEMTEYYSGLAKQYGDITARYKNAVCLVWDKEHSYESMEESLSGEPFLLTAMPHPKRQKGFPLDCLTKNIVTGAYYYDMVENRQDQADTDNGFLLFFQKILRDRNVL